MRRWLRLPSWIWDQWRIIHEESIVDAPLDAGGRRKLDWRPLVVLIVVAASLTLQEYVGERRIFSQWFERGDVPVRYWELLTFAWWTFWRVFGYLILPMLVLLAMPGERILHYGLSFKGFRKHFWIYVVLYLAVLPMVVVASTTQPFLHTYPFYKLAGRSTFDLVAWEILYALQFLSLEFFFRGFILHGLKRAVGVHAIWIMIVPYTMIHYGKPVAETCGAMFAGIILGTLAMRTKSIWSGVLIHISVAVTMDLLALGCWPPGGYCR